MTSRGRLDFFDMPAAVIAAVEAAVDGAILQHDSAAGGFSPGPAGRCQLEDGRLVFVKACSEELSPLAIGMHRREAEVLPLLPVDHPSPTLLTTVDLDDWFVLVVEHVSGYTPTAPITNDETTAVLDLVTALAEAGTPNPVDGLSPMGSNRDELAFRLVWNRMVDEGPPQGLDPWSRRHLQQLATLEADWIDAVAGNSLLHRDLRPDNMVLNGQVGIAVDWPGASVGAPWVDLVGLLPGLHLMDGPSPTEVFDRHPVASAADGPAVDCFLALLTGYFVGQSHQPPVPNVPGLRTFQADQGAVCQRWLSERMGWDPPDAARSEPID